MVNECLKELRVVRFLVRLNKTCGWTSDLGLTPPLCTFHWNIRWEKGDHSQKVSPGTKGGDRSPFN